jgi:hypothetical protein
VTVKTYLRQLIAANQCHWQLERSVFNEVYIKTRGVTLRK